MRLARSDGRTQRRRLCDFVDLDPVRAGLLGEHRGPTDLAGGAETEVDGGLKFEGALGGPVFETFSSVLICERLCASCPLADLDEGAEESLPR